VYFVYSPHYSRKEQKTTGKKIQQQKGSTGQIRLQFANVLANSSF